MSSVYYADRDELVAFMDRAMDCWVYQADGPCHGVRLLRVWFRMLSNMFEYTNFWRTVVSNDARDKGYSSAPDWQWFSEFDERMSSLSISVFTPLIQLLKQCLQPALLTSAAAMKSHLSKQTVERLIDLSVDYMGAVNPHACRIYDDTDVDSLIRKVPESFIYRYHHERALGRLTEMFTKDCGLDASLVAQLLTVMPPLPVLVLYGVHLEVEYQKGELRTAAAAQMFRTLGLPEMTLPKNSTCIAHLVHVYVSYGFRQIEEQYEREYNGISQDEVRVTSAMPLADQPLLQRATSDERLVAALDVSLDAPVIFGGCYYPPTSADFASERLNAHTKLQEFMRGGLQRGHTLVDTTATDSFDAYSVATLQRYCEMLVKMCSDNVHCMPLAAWDWVRQSGFWFGRLTDALGKSDSDGAAVVFTQDMWYILPENTKSRYLLSLRPVVDGAKDSCVLLGARATHQQIRELDRRVSEFALQSRQTAERRNRLAQSASETNTGVAAVQALPRKVKSKKTSHAQSVTASAAAAAVAGASATTSSNKQTSQYTNAVEGVAVAHAQNSGVLSKPTRNDVSVVVGGETAKTARPARAARPTLVATDTVDLTSDAIQFDHAEDDAAGSVSLPVPPKRSRKRKASTLNGDDKSTGPLSSGEPQHASVDFVEHRVTQEREEEEEDQGAPPRKRRARNATVSREPDVASMRATEPVHAPAAGTETVDAATCAAAAAVSSQSTATHDDVVVPMLAPVEESVLTRAMYDYCDPKHATESFAYLVGEVGDYLRQLSPRLAESFGQLVDKHDTEALTLPIAMSYGLAKEPFSCFLSTHMLRSRGGARQAFSPKTAQPLTMPDIVMECLTYLSSDLQVRVNVLDRLFEYDSYDARRSEMLKLGDRHLQDARRRSIWCASADEANHIAQTKSRPLVTTILKAGSYKGKTASDRVHMHVHLIVASVALVDILSARLLAYFAVPVTPAAAAAAAQTELTPDPAALFEAAAARRWLGILHHYKRQVVDYVSTVTHLLPVIAAPKLP